MIKMKEKIKSALLPICENVYDYLPKENVTYPLITYMEEENCVNEWTDDQEQDSYVKYRIDLYCSDSAEEMCTAIDKQLAGVHGLKRIHCQDLNEDVNVKHKMLRYEAIIAMTSDDNIMVYHKYEGE